MLASILYGLAHVVSIVLNMVMLVIIVSVGITWFGGDPYNPYVRMIRSLTDPMYQPFRRWTRNIGGPIDLSPMVVMLIVVFLQKSMPMFLMDLSQQLK